MKTALITTFAAMTFCLCLAACSDGDSGPGVVAEPKPIDPANQVTPGSANFQNPEMRND